MLARGEWSDVSVLGLLIYKYIRTNTHAHTRTRGPAMGLEPARADETTTTRPIRRHKYHASGGRGGCAALRMALAALQKQTHKRMRTCEYSLTWSQNVFCQTREKGTKLFRFRSFPASCKFRSEQRFLIRSMRGLTRITGFGLRFMKPAYSGLLDYGLSLERITG